MNLSEFVKCLKGHALNKNISDEKFLNALLKPYVLAGEVDNKLNEEFYLNKSRTSLLLNRIDDVPGALREVLNQPNIYSWTEENFKDFIKEYLKPGEMPQIISEVCKMIHGDKSDIDYSFLIKKKNKAHVFLADTMIECIKVKNDGFDPGGELVRNGSYCLSIVYDDIFKYAFRKRTKRKNIIVVPVDSEFHTHITRAFEKNRLHEVSAQSLHGQFLSRFEQSGEKLEKLPIRITEDLSKRNVKKDSFGKYPIGTIAVIEHSSAIFFLLVISNFDENNNAHSSKEDIMHSMDELSVFYDKYGEGYDLYIPLFGTGKSRSAISLQESYDMIVNCYKNNPERIQGNIHVVIHKDFEKQVITKEV